MSGLPTPHVYRLAPTMAARLMGKANGGILIDDAIVVRENWMSAYDFASDSGALALNDYARANDPFAAIGREQVAVDVTSVIRASPRSFRVAWVERRYRDGALAETTRWTAILGVAVQPPRTPDALTSNPLGIFVTSINWSKELG